MNCAACGEKFNDGVQCSACKRDLGFCCASITEAGYRKLGPERRAAWRCSQCKLSGSVSPLVDSAAAAGPVGVTTEITSPPESEAVSLSMIFQEIVSIKRQLTGLPSLIEDVKIIKSDISDLKATCDFYGSTLDEHKSRISTLESKISGMKTLEDNLNAALVDIAALRGEMADRDQRSRLNNIEVKGVPLRKSENLFKIVENIGKAVGFDLPKSEINYIARVPTHNPNEKSIVLSIHNRYVKEDFVAAARENKSLSTVDVLGDGDAKQRVYVNDHLTPYNKQLLSKTKAVAKEKNYKYVWIKYCKIHVRKNDSAKILVVANEKDLNKLS